jgi:predicted ABC-class ATPase
MRDKREFAGILKSLDGQAPAELKQLAGDFDFTRFVLHALRIGAGADGAEDTLFVLHVPQLIAGFPPALFKSPIRRTALEDFLARKVAEVIEAQVNRAGHSRVRSIYIAEPGPQVLPRSSIIVAQDFVEARLSVRMPLLDGRVDARGAEAIFFEDFPAIVNEALLYCYHDAAEVARFIEVMEDGDAVRQALPGRGLIGFVGEGSRLPGLQVPVQVEESAGISIDAPNAGPVRGLGIPSGVTLIVGDPYSGRRELLQALAMGIYNHIPGDGREWVLTVPDAVAVEAEPGRPVQQVDVRPFLTDRPGMRADAFSALGATAAESQMAGVVEAVQAGAQALLFDEDTSDPSFLAADVNLLAREGRAAGLAPLAARARQIADQWRVSLVIGACACAEEFIPAADAIFLCDGGRLRDITREAKEQFGSKNLATAALGPLPSPAADSRVVIPGSIDPSLRMEDAVIAPAGREFLRFGRTIVELSAISQIAEEAQTRTIGLLIYYAKLHYLDEPRTVAQVLDLLDQDLASEGLDAVTRELRGDLARPRRYEIAAALNRLSSLRIAPAR